MRVALITPAFSPASPWGVHQYHLHLAQALRQQDVEVEVLAPRDIPGLAPMGQRREVWRGIGVTSIHGTQEANATDWEIALRAFLNREAPDVVHFCWLPQGGEGLVQVARDRGLATIYHAQDFHAFGGDAFALSPDLKSFEPDDWEARARGVLARALLDRHPALGDHGGHVLRGQVDDAFWKHIQTLLHGEEPPGIQEARDNIATARSARRRAVQSMQGRFATSKELAKQLEGRLPTSVDLVRPGIDLEAYSALPAPRAGRGPIRFGYLGPMEKSQGVHDLLAAFAGLKNRAELRLFGSGRDRRYLRTLRARAQECGARWYGDLTGEDRVHALERIDVLVVPTLWDQSAPFEIREAFAARRPVIVANFPGLSAGVRDREDGLHFQAGRVDSLRAALECFIEEPDLLTRLEVGIRAPRDIAAEAGEWAETYKLSVAGAKASQTRPEAPTHLAHLAIRYQEWQKLPTRELYERVAHGLQGLAARMGLDWQPLTSLTEAIATGAHGRDSAVTFERVQNWLSEQRAEMAQQAQARAQSAAQAQDKSTPSPQLTPQTAAWMPAPETGALALPPLEIPNGEIENIRRWVKQVNAQRAKIEARMQQLEFQAAQRIERQRATQGRMLEREQNMRLQLGELARRMMTDAEAPVAAGEAIAPDSVDMTFAAMHAIVRRNREEIVWRRAEMAKAKGVAGGFLARLVGGDASALMREWDEIPAGERSTTPPTPAFKTSHPQGGPTPLPGQSQTTNTSPSPLVQPAPEANQPEQEIHS